MSQIPSFCKELVIGYIVFESEDNTVTTVPIKSQQTFYDKTSCTSFCDGCEDNMQSFGVVKGILQAPFPTYEVCGFDVTGSCKIIGYEHPGMKSVNWSEELRQFLDEAGNFKDYKPMWNGAPPFKGSIVED